MSDQRTCRVSATHERNLSKRFDFDSGYWVDVYQKPDVWGTILRLRHSIALEYFDKLRVSNRAEILEVGCGAGFMSVSVAKRGFTVRAIDISSSMVKETVHRARQEDVRRQVNPAVADAHRLVFKDSTFDVIIALGVIAWLDDLKMGLSEVARVLKPGGFFIFSIDNPRRFWVDPALLIQGGVKKALRKLGLRDQYYRGHAHYYTVKEINRNLSKVGLKTIKKSSFGFGPFSFFYHKIFSDKTGVKIHQKLQRYSDNGYSLLSIIGTQSLILATKRGVNPPKTAQV